MDPKPFKSTVYNAGSEGVKKIVRTAEGWVKDIITEKIKVVVDLTAIYKSIKDYVDLLFSTLTLDQVNSDWNATSGVEEILNKPDLLEIGEWDEDISFEFRDLTAGTAQA